MEGQLSLFDIHNGTKRPCDYRFKRYIGQKVNISISEGDFVGEVIRIEPYYTIIRVPGYPHLLAGTPTTFGPVNKEEKDESC